MQIISIEPEKVLVLFLLYFYARRWLDGKIVMPEDLFHVSYFSLYNLV